MSSALIGQPSDSKPRTAYKPRKSIKAPAIQSAVLAKRANGESKRKISKDLDIAYNTVTSVIDLNQFDEALAKNQASSIALIPQAIRVAEHRLAQNSENMAIKVLENTIWPLNGKGAKGMKAGDSLFLSIQNLIQPTAVKPSESTENSVVIDTELVKPTT